MLQQGLPSKEDMWAELKEKQTWKRDTMPNAGAARSYMMQTHQLHYYDELLEDMGAPVCRKRGWFAAVREFFEPYRPRDYNTIVTGSFKTEPSSSVPRSSVAVTFTSAVFRKMKCRRRMFKSKANGYGSAEVFQQEEEEHQK